MGKYRVWFSQRANIFSGPGHLLELKEHDFCDRVNLETQGSHYCRVYGGYLLTLTFGSETRGQTYSVYSLILECEQKGCSRLAVLFVPFHFIFKRDT